MFFRKENIDRQLNKTKRWRKLTFCLFIIFTVFICINYLVSQSGRLSWKSELIFRKSKLMAWRNRIKYILDKTGRLPKSLYEASIFERLGIVYAKVSVPQDYNSYKEEDELLRDPNSFFQRVEYALVVHHKGWFIMELKLGKRYPYILLIDQDANFCELRKPKSTDPSSWRIKKEWISK